MQYPKSLISSGVRLVMEENIEAAKGGGSQDWAVP